MKSKSSKKNRASAIFLAVILCVIIAFIGAIIYYQHSRTQKAQPATKIVTSSESSESNNTSHKSAEKTDADEYYKSNSKKLISVTPAPKSKKVYTEKGVAKQLSLRGFGAKFPVTYEYNIDGSFKQKTQIDKSSDSKHPQYTVTYMTKSGDYWTVSVCNNCLTAYPVTYNLEHNSGAEVILSESESITAYDSTSNCFYETIPKQSALIVKQIPSITAETLESLTAQDIEKL